MQKRSNQKTNSMNTIIKPISKQVVVAASQETAFKVFTANMDSWWPRTHHIGNAPMVEFIVEPGAGGRWYSKHEDGSEVNVGKVIKWDPFESLILNWQIDGNFKCNPDLITEVEVQFIPLDAKTTKVLLEHRNLERLGEGKAVESMDEGWGQIMELYKKNVTAKQL